MFFTTVGRYVGWLMVVVSIAGLPASVRGQQAAITGRVNDASGAALPGATVVLTSVDRGIRTVVVSNAEGYYAFPLVPPGKYTLSAELTGFRSQTRTDIGLEVQQVARFDFTLELGALSESVDVAAPITESQTSALGHVVDNTRIRELPLNGRNPLELSRLTPGVTMLATAFLDTRNFNLTSVSINGGQGGSNAVLIDGGSTTLPERNEYAVAPNVDAVQEFRVQTNTLSAEFGLTGGGVINLVTKSGTNQLRGTLFEFRRDDAFDATGWTNNRNNLEKSPLNYDQFGASTGGPIRLPKVFGPLAYDGRNRSFFFFNYEGIRFDSAVTVLSRVPTELERRGDFSQTLVRTSTGTFIPVQLYDPGTTRPNPSGSGFVRDRFATPVIPTTRLDPVALRAVNVYPLPNRAPDDPTGRNNFIGTPGIISDSNQYTARVDHQISNGNRLFVRYSHNDSINTGNAAVFAVDNIGDPGLSLQNRHNKSVTISDTHAFSSRVLNEVRLSVARQYLLSEPAGYGIDAPGQLGFPAIIPTTLFPRLVVGSEVLGGDSREIGSSPGQLSVRGLTVGQLAEALTIVRGKHTVKTGVDLRVELRNNFQPGPVSGQFNFTRAMTGNPQDTSGTTGFGLATAMLGAVSGGMLDSPLSRADGWRYYAAFAQDDYRILPRLTLNLGLRYDIITAPTDRFDRYSNFNPSALNPVLGVPGVLQYAGVDFGRRVYDTNYDNVAPRVGFAYDVSGNARTIVRGGYGISYYHSGVLEYPDIQGFSTSTQFASPQGSAFPAFQLATGPSQLVTPSGNSLGPLSFLGNNVTHFEKDRPTPSTQQWNLTVQRELRWRMLLEMAYAGSHGTHIMGYTYDLNQLDPQYQALGLALDDRVPNPFFGLIPPGTQVSGATIARRQALRPFPAYLNVIVGNPPLGRTTYHSGQFKLERRFFQGLGMLSSYTLARLEGDVGRSIIDFGTVGGAPQGNVMCAQNAKFDRRSCRSIEPQDVTHTFVLSTVYEIPIGQGQRFLSSGGILSNILGGFQINGILSLRSGLPLVVRGANNGVADRPNLVGDPALPSDERTPARWFNTSAFAAPAPFTFGDTPRALSNPRGPGFAAVDFSLSKNVIFSSATRFQLRAEFFNLFNRVNLNQPNVNFLSGEFGQIVAADQPRRVQLGAKLYF
jgi:outer membrane receptor protein involved in Fe transport